MAESAIFLWEGTDKQGKKTKGEITSASPAIARAELRRQGIVANKVRKKGKGFSLTAGGSVKPADVALFTRQMATMMRAGVPLVQAFDIVADGLDKPKVSELVRHIRNDVAGGSSFASALRKHPLYFDDLFCNLVDAGEQSGALETMLDRIATYKEKSESLKAKVKKAMTYPIAVLCVAFIVSGILLIKVVPQFQDVFAGFGAELPAFTQFVINISDFTQDYWMVIVAAEFFPGTKSGVGYMITTAQEVSEYQYAFASIVVIGLMGILINALLGRIERRVGRWQARER